MPICGRNHERAREKCPACSWKDLHQTLQQNKEASLSSRLNKVKHAAKNPLGRLHQFELTESEEQEILSVLCTEEGDITITQSPEQDLSCHD